MKVIIRILFIISIISLYHCGSFQMKAGDKTGTENKSGDYNEEFFPDDKSSSAKPSVQSSGEKNKNEAEIKTDVEKGYASWYGKELQGKPTASGELFDMNKFTAAHRTFSMGSLVLIRNLENGKKKLVRINDRGPYVDGRIIDVSYGVARDLDFVQQGVARVEVELIEESHDDFLAKTDSKDLETGDSNKDESATENEISENEPEDTQNSEVEKIEENEAYAFSDGVRPHNFTVRTGAFKRQRNAEKYKEELEDKYNINAYLGKKGKWHFVWIGDFENKSAAKKFYKKLKTDGLDVLNPGKVQ